ncbi:alpha-amylase family protein [Sinomonas humi]|uniref:Alpha-amylase n=1 Tax=Sinomonas humi TaxID=1338436 RepID=A0A0B2AEE2_9MICC|nr:alpha-amylase family protein [Sinomonas humi]KHL01904.1 trehalose synthase [Sinomonas humi]
MRITDTSDLWWKTGIIYCLDVETFFDSNGDGCGDLAGLAERVDYIAEIGVTCVWLMPFYPTPHRDDGYDITDFFGVDDRLGHHGDLVEFIRMAQDRGLRVIVDLVVNHTSDQHPWFRAARSSKDNPFRDFYVWRSDPPPDTSKEVVFPDQEKSIWTLDEATGEWYLHHFYKEQPDLNVANPKVRDEIAKVIGFWLHLGISGFRVDAVPYFLSMEGVRKEELEKFHNPHDYLRALRRFMGRRAGDSVLLGEVNLPYEHQMDYFGGPEGDELTMMFDFIAMQKTYLSLAQQDARPLAQALRDRPWLPPDNQWATFVRNHDELTLDKLSEDERREVFEAFGPEPEMQVFGRGLKRRVPPMLDGDPRRIRLVYSLLFTLPGTPVLYYGEEIGMGEDLSAEGRMAVRTPMQWTAEPSAGFSTAPPDKLVSRIPEGGYGPRYVNVSAARRDPDSLLNFITRLAQRYRECPELGWGTHEVLEHPVASVLAHRVTWEDASMVALHNLSPEAATVPLRLGRPPSGSSPDAPACWEHVVLLDLLRSGVYPDEGLPVGEDGAVEVPIEGYGHAWLRIHRPDQRRLL